MPSNPEKRKEYNKKYRERNRYAIKERAVNYIEKRPEAKIEFKTIIKTYNLTLEEASSITGLKIKSIRCHLSTHPNSPTEKTLQKLREFVKEKG